MDHFVHTYCWPVPSIVCTNISNACGPTWNAVPNGRSSTKMVQSTRAMPAIKTETPNMCSRVSSMPTKHENDSMFIEKPNRVVHRMGASAGARRVRELLWIYPDR
jgi:hypothetical protein